MKFKKILSVLMVLSMILSTIGIPVFAENTNVAKVGNTEYATIDEAVTAWTNGTTLTLLANVTLSDVITLKSTEHHILDLSTYTMTAASGKNAIVIQACGTGSAESSAITINADAANPGGINAGSKSIVYYKYADGGISTEDRPIIKINGGVFTGSTSVWGTAGIYTIGTAARKCATLNISGGTFNCSINGSGKSKLIITGGTFNYSVGSQGDSTANRLISGGTFKTIGFMTADSNNTKFWIGTSMGNSNVGVYVDDNGYIVIGGTPVKEAGDTFEASSANYSGASSYLQYSSAKDNGLYYTSVEEAFADNNKTTGSVTVYVDELDMTNIAYKGTIVVPEGQEILITVEEGTTPAWTVSADADAVTYTNDEGKELEINSDGSFETKKAKVDGVNVEGIDVNVYRVEGTINSYSISLADGTEWTDDTSAVITLPAVEGAVDGDMAYVMHEHDGNNYFYVGKVENGGVTFTNNIGFSTFTVNEGGLSEALASAQAGDTVTLLDDITGDVNVNKSIVFDGNNKKVTGKLNVTANGATVKNLTVENSGGTAGYISAKNVLIENCNVTGNNGFRYCYTSGTVTFKDSTIAGSVYGIHFDGNSGGNIVINNCQITGWTSFAGTIEYVTIEDTEFNEGNYNYIRFYQSATIDGCTFNEKMGVDVHDSVDATVKVSNSTVVNGTVEDLFESNDIDRCDVYVNNEILVNYVAKIGDKKYASLQAAIDAAKDNEIVEILPGEYSAINISNKNITIQGTVGDNGELLTTIKGGNPAITGHSFNGTIKDIKIVDAWKVMYAEPAGSVTVDNVYVTGATYGFHLVAYSSGLIWTIQNSYMDLSWANSLGVYNDGDAEIIIKGNKFVSTNPYYSDYGALHVNSFLPKVTVEENIFGKNAKIYIDKSVTDTSNINISKNYHADGVENAFADDDDGVIVKIDSYYTVVGEDGTLSGLVEVVDSVAKIGDTEYATLQAAIDAAQNGETVILLSDVALSEALIISKDAEIVLELNGKTITYNSTIQGEAMITNKGNLTIKDSVGGGVINYNYTGAADSSYGKGNYTISNAGILTVNGGKITIANLRAHAKYPIDNNSTTGDAMLVINGGHLYNYNTSAIRQFCNSTTYKNSVIINGGIIEGYSAIWIQNPGNKTVNGQLTITGGEIKTTAAAYVNGTANLKDVSSNIYCTVAGGAWDEASKVAITGGIFNENVYLAKNAPATIVISEEGPSFNGRLEIPADYVAETEGIKYTSLQNAIDAVTEGETVTLIADITEEVKIDNKNVIIDLNRYTLKGAILPSTGDITVKNGSLLNTNSDYSAIEINSGKLTLENVNIESARHCVRIDGAVTAVIDGGEYKLTAASGTRHNVNVSGDADVIIKNGTFIGPKGTTMDSGSAVCVQSGATVTIEGGNFSGGKNATLGVSGTMLIKGGVFDQDPSAYCVEGYMAAGVNGEITSDEYSVYKNFDIKTVCIYNFPLTPSSTDGVSRYPVAMFGAISNLNYAEVGFIFEIEDPDNGNIIKQRFAKTNTFKSIKVSDQIKEEFGIADNKITPEYVDANAKYFFGDMANFGERFADSSVKYRPYAKLLDGTYIYGKVRALEDITNKN